MARQHRALPLFGLGSLPPALHPDEALLLWQAVGLLTKGGKAATAALVVVASHTALMMLDTPYTHVTTVEATEVPALFSDTVVVMAGVLAVCRLKPRRRSREPLPSPLSPREMEVVQLIAQGLSTKEIAARLYLSPKTVDAHRVRIHKKLDVHDRVALTRLALERGWVQSGES